MAGCMLNTTILQLICLLAISVLFKCSLAFVQGVMAGDRESELIAILTDRNFEHFRDKNEALLVEFYLPSCSHCSLFRDEFVKAAELGNENGLKVIFGAVNAEDYEAMSAYFKVFSFPTVRLFYNATSILYEGSQGFYSLFNWTKNKLSFHPEVVTVEEFDMIKDNEELGLAFLGPEGLEFDQFKRFARTLEGIRILHVNYKKPGNRIEKALWSSEKPFSIILFKSHGQTLVVYDLPDLSIEQLSSFFKSRRYPLISTLDTDCSMRRVFHEPGLSILYLIDDKKDQFRGKFSQVARSYSPKINFYLVRKTDKYAQEIRDYLNLNRNHLSQIWAIFHTEDGIESFCLNNEINARHLHRFVQRIDAGRITPISSNSTEASILINLSTSEGRHFISQTKAMIVVFNYKGRHCARRRSCLVKLSRFRRFAELLHHLADVEFCTLDYDTYFRVSKANFFRHFRTALPAISMSGGRLKNTMIIKDFDWRFQSLYRLLVKILGIKALGSRFKL